MDARQEVGSNGHHSSKDRDADGDCDPLARGYEAGGNALVRVRDFRGRGDGRGDNGGDMAEETAEQRRDQQPQPDGWVVSRISSAVMPPWTSNAAKRTMRAP